MSMLTGDNPFEGIKEGLTTYGQRDAEKERVAKMNKKLADAPKQPWNKNGVDTRSKEEIFGKKKQQEEVETSGKNATTSYRERKRAEAQAAKDAILKRHAKGAEEIAKRREAQGRPNFEETEVEESLADQMLAMAKKKGLNAKKAGSSEEQKKERDSVFAKRKAQAPQGGQKPAPKKHETDQGKIRGYGTGKYQGD